MATPMDSTKPSNTQRTNAVARRRVWSIEAVCIG
jgi:hypothetical protein